MLHGSRIVRRTTFSPVLEQGRDNTMPRIVQCPKCRSLLREPPPGNPYYQCGSCSTTLQAKHATQAELDASKRRINADLQKRNSFSDSSSGEMHDRVADEFTFSGNGSDFPLYTRKDLSNSSRLNERGTATQMKFDNSQHMIMETQVTNQQSHDNSQYMMRETQVTNQQARDNSQYMMRETQVVNQQAHDNSQYMMRETQVTNQQAQDGALVSYMQSFNKQELDMNQLTLETVSGSDYLQRRAAQQQDNIRPVERWPSSPEQPYGNAVLQAQRSQGRNHAEETCSPQFNPSTIVRDRGAESFRTRPRNETSAVGVMPQVQVSHQQLRSGYPPEVIQGLGHHHITIGVQQNYESSANGVDKSAMGPNDAATGAARSKLRWQARESDSTDEIPSRGPPVRTMAEDDRIPHDNGEMGAGVKETTSVESVVERNWRTLGSRRRSFEDRRSFDERGGGRLVRTGSEESDQTFDMYDNPTYVGDYEPSETSSTMDEADTSERSPSGQYSGEMGRISPPLDQGLTRSVSRPNLPRSNASSGRSGFSEESSSYNSQTEMGSPDNHIDNARRVAAARRHSWDERASRMGSPANNSGSPSNNSGSPAHNSGAPHVPASVRQKSSSQDYGSGPNPSELLHRVSSDPGGSYRGDQFQVNQAAMYPSPHRQSQSTLRPSQQNYQQQQPQQQQQWVGYPPSSPPAAHGSPTRQQWSPTALGRSYLPESNSVHSSHQSRPSFPSRPMPGQGQLPPKQGYYPPLPAPGVLPHVSCQSCGVLLAVPTNLPPPKKNTQKLRCGACMRISTFSVPHTEGFCLLPSSTASRSDAHTGQSLLASSPDHQAELTSNYRVVNNKSLGVESPRDSPRDSPRGAGRRFSISELRENQVQMPHNRKHSLENEDSVPTDQEIGEPAFSGMGELLPGGSYPATISSVQSSIVSVNSDIGITSNYSDAPPSNSMEYTLRFPGGGPVSSGPLYQKRGGPDPRFVKMTQVTGSRVEERVQYGMQNNGGNIALEERRPPEVFVTSSDSDGDLGQRRLSANASPRLNNGTSESPSYPNSPGLQDLNPSLHPTDHTNEQMHDVPRGLNRALKGILGIRKSVLELTKSKHAGAGGHYRRKVVVNGVPIPDHLVKKAEEQAGPIHPGTYWYDSRAGFWGTAGGQCLGIIPPFIEEFNYPMSRDCAGGRTGILVNGRELHSADREKLASRGLSEMAGMSYRIEIDGRVIEEDTKSELKGLGRLAPSLERQGRGSGMYVPASFAGAGNRS